MQNEKEIMEIIANGGDARSSSLKAIRCARNGQWEEVDVLLKRAGESLSKAHKVQTQLIQSEIRGEKSEISLLMIHAQDHLMNAITLKELAIELIEEVKKRFKFEESMKGMLEND
ncbi:PTS lactose/cellobiose transporter subunit IIA [Niallia circulans]|uniref:PTS lactose/cellobiose transporter subunit IIA n=1 Tax=Niallia circulans TaxID=1397 RepID=UPI0015615AC9|nr:PTS lactose/cellobiose transporter subunit IIA [Niallia circulans]NRG33071.1 PTS lactose/cellobiose transporter subunit IIA [Niallia circulans]